MDDLPVQKISIAGPTFAALLHRISSAAVDVDGLLFGHISLSPATSLSDDAAISTTSLTAIITSFTTSISTLSFYDSSGNPNPLLLRRLLPSPKATLLGWFLSRRRSPLRPSFREYSVSYSLSSNPHLSFQVENKTFSPSIFFLFTTPFSDQVVHTHEYRAYQYKLSSNLLEPASVDIVNIGPAFRAQYEAFCPNSRFPWLPCETRGEPMAEDGVEEERANSDFAKRVGEEQREVDACAEGLEVGSLSKLIGSGAASYRAGVEEVYEKLLAKLESLAREVERSSAKVLEQENQNMRLRYKVAGLN